MIMLNFIYAVANLCKVLFYPFSLVLMLCVLFLQENYRVHSPSHADEEGASDLELGEDEDEDEDEEDDVDDNNEVDLDEDDVDDVGTG